MADENRRLDDVTLVILAGGMGLRLREETERVPKPLVSIGEKPMLWHIMKLYRHHGVRHFVVCLGYKGWLIKEYFLRYREHVSDFTISNGQGGVEYHNDIEVEDWDITFAETGLLDGTGSRLRQAGKYVRGETFMCTYGDGLGSVDIGALYDFHKAHDHIGTVTGVQPRSRYGMIQVEGDRALAFDEKPKVADGFVNGGFFVFKREFLDWLPEDREHFFEEAPMKKLAADGQLGVFPHDGYWIGMDTYRDFTEVNELWAGGDAPWKVWNE